MTEGRKEVGSSIEVKDEVSLSNAIVILKVYEDDGVRGRTNVGLDCMKWKKGHSHR